MVVADGLAYTVGGEPVCSPGDTRSCGTTDVGVCELGERDCTGGMWGDCLGAVEPTPEVSDNGLDDDCDGFTDGTDPDCAPPADHVVIVQVGYDTPGDDAQEEFVDLFNPTASDVSLDGWSLTDNLATWFFPAEASIAAGSYLSVARDANGFCEPPFEDDLNCALDCTG